MEIVGDRCSMEDENGRLIAVKEEFRASPAEDDQEQ